MKYTITRQFSLKQEKFEIINHSKMVCTVKAVPPKVFNGQFSVKLTNLLASTNVGDDKCIIESDPNKARNYLIYLQNNPSNDKILFGQLSYELCGYANYLYTIVIGRKLYKVRSCDLKDRRLAIIDTIEQNNSDSYATIQCPETLFQVTDSFSKSNKTYHVTVNDKEKQLGYLAIIILLDLHECKRE